MYNSLFWSISPQDAVTQGGFLVDIVDDDIQKNTGLFREGTDHAPLVNYRNVTKTCARAKDLWFLGPKGSCACRLGLPKVLKQSAMGQ